MDEKDFKKNKEKDGKGKDIVYGTDPPQFDHFIFKEPSTAAYSIDAERERMAKREMINVEYQKYLNLPEMTRAEFVDGKIIYLGEPNRKHQELLGTLQARFHNYLHGKTCEVYLAPFGVKIDFDSNPNSKNTLQPDLLVICDMEKLDDNGLNGTPDLVIEILSPSTASYDKGFKYKKYMLTGVKEYLLVDPDRETVTVNILISGNYMSRVYKKGEVIKVSILDTLYINVTDLFEGYKGAEIEEVEVAREEEREKSKARLEEIRKKSKARLEEKREKVEDHLEEKREKAEARESQIQEEVREKAEAWKLEMFEKLLRAGLPKEKILEITGLI